jgi:nucleoside-diphosphate-sugar epimerase
LTDRLERSGARIHATSRTNRADEPNLSWHQVDLRDAGHSLRLIDQVRPDFIFHLASMVTGERDRSVVLPTLHANLVSSVNLLDAVARLGCKRLVLLGSLEEPSASKAGEFPSSPYAASKAAASSYARMYHRLFDTPASVARVFMVYGPGPQEERRLVPYVIKSLLNGETPRLTAGTRPVDWVYVLDVIDGLLQMAVAPSAVGEVVDIGSGHLVPVAEVVRRIFRLLGRTDEPPFGSIEDRPYEQVRQADVDSTFRMIKWRPSMDLDRGLSRTVGWFTRHPASH